MSRTGQIRPSKQSPAHLPMRSQSVPSPTRRHTLRRPLVSPHSQLAFHRHEFGLTGPPPPSPEARQPCQPALPFVKGPHSMAHSRVPPKVVATS